MGADCPAAARIRNENRTRTVKRRMILQDWSSTWHCIPNMRSSAPYLRHSSAIENPLGGLLRFSLVIVLFLTCATHAFSSDQPPVPIERLIKESKFQEADREIQQKLHENPADARALTYLGDLRRAQSKYLQAEAAYRKALLAH